jgi:hypothetical protein
LPEDAPQILTNLYKYSELIYDIEEELPHTSESHSPELRKAFAQLDKERFPRDLPEYLIRDLLISDANPAKDA